MRGIGSSVEIEQLAQQGAGAGLRILRQGQRQDPGLHGVIGIAGDQEGGLLGRGHMGRFGRRRVLTGEQPLMGPVA